MTARADTAPSNMQTRLTLGVLPLLLLPPLFWAGNAVVGRAVSGKIPPMALSFWRWAIAFLVILPFTARGIVAARDVIRTSWRDLVVFSIAGIGVYNSFQYLALQTTTALNVTLVASSGPVFTLIAGALFFHHSVSRLQVLGALLSIAGVLWVVGRGSLDAILALHLTPGDGYMLFAIAVWSIYTWLLRTRRPAIAPAPFLALQIGIGTLAILPFYVAETIITGRSIALDGQVLAALAYVGLLPSLAAYFCWDRAVARTGAALPAYFVNVTPVFAALLAVIFLDEHIASFHLIGAACIFVGIVVASRTGAKQ
jgi:drug/metabolite transporter (DMT)-like permease